MTQTLQVHDSATPASTQPIPTAGLSGVLRFLRDPLQFMAGAQSRYGDMVALNLGLTRMVVVNHPAHIDHVLRRNAENYPKEGSMWDGLRTLLGNGLIVSQGDFWRRQRRMMQPHFKPRRLEGLTELIAEAIAEVIDTWDERLDEPVDMNKVCPHMTMAVIVKAIFGTVIEEADVRAVGDALAYALEYLLRGMILQSLPDWFPVPGRKRYQDSLATIDDVVYRMIARRRAANDADESGDANGGDDLLSMLLNLVDEETGDGMTDEQLHDEVVNLFLAGYETTANGMAWALYLVAEHPEVAARIRAEVDEAVGERRPGFHDLPGLTYTRMVVQEALRLYCPAWQIMRTAINDDQVGGYKIAAGTQLMLCFYNSLRHPDMWSTPDTFDPARFTPEAQAERPKEAWIPFGTGQRQCIGKELSLMESTLILAMVLQRYELKTVAHKTPQPKLSMVLTSKDGVWLQLAARKPTRA